MQDKIKYKFRHFKNVKTLKYLGITVTAQNCNHRKKIRALQNPCYYAA